jgi:hypothetical protein
MRARCNDIDRQRLHYRKLACTDSDPLTVAAAETVIADLNAEKLALHPDVADDP